MLRTRAGAYSLRKIAVASPTGRAMMQAPAVTSKVPTTRGQTPKRWGVNRGVHLVSPKKSAMGTSRKKSTVSVARMTIMPTVVPMDTRPHISRMP